MGEPISELLDVSHEYIHQPLKQSGYVRLLKLHTLGEQIECSLKQFPLVEAKFEALSYVWGGEEKPFRAIIRDTRGRNLGFLSLTRNLHNALRDLRDTPELEGTNFWIDQICIDQNGEEKNHQVKMMNKIYKSASRVMVHIGTPQSPELDRRGVQLLDELDRHFAPNYDFILERGNIWNAIIGRHDLSVRKLSQNIDRNYGPEDWNWLANLASGIWYDRLWMVQEQLANANIIMLRGRHLLAWDKVAAMTILFAVGVLPQQYWPSSNRQSILESTVYSLWRDRQDRCFEFPCRTLLENINWYGCLRCRDLRDFLYALLGISLDSDELHIYPDYSEANTVEQLFLDTTIRILKVATNLSVLEQACRFKHRYGLPTWALMPSSEFYFIAVPHGFSPHVRSQLATRPTISANNTLLALKGSCVDEVELLTPNIVPPEGKYNGPMNDLWIQPATQYLSALASIMSHAGVTLPHAAALGRVMRIVYSGLVPDSDFEQSVTVRRAADYTCSSIRFWAQEISTYDRKLLPCTTKVLSVCENIVHKLYEAMQSPYAQKDGGGQAGQDEREIIFFPYFNLPRATVFCVSKRGRIGIVQEGVMVEDVLAAFEGADWLYALRPEGSRYHLVGSAYVDGLMNGEFYANNDPDDVDEVIELI
ncbi:MAG: hypothetical protein M1820_006973 [Bogoriella megaspora]|nr:MAG: hypothetical protein M1820_006973 [Bogoriella megaspora]